MFILRYVITPDRRSSAEAIHLMLTHALGEAGAPFLVGFIIDAMKSQVNLIYLEFRIIDYSYCSSNQVKESHPGYCTDMINYIAVQRSLFVPFSLLLLGGLLFLLATKWVSRDKYAAEANLIQNTDKDS